MKKSPKICCELRDLAEQLEHFVYFDILKEVSPDWQDLDVICDYEEFPGERIEFKVIIGWYGEVF
nr:MAG: hypothetical protein [Lokiarchaeota virus Skoll Meg22_1214]